MRIEPWGKLACRSAHIAGRYAQTDTAHSLGRLRVLACLRVIEVIVFSALLFAPLLSWLNRVAAQTTASSSGQAGFPLGDKVSQQGVIRITVNLVQVDAVVTDSKGHQVTNLRPEDFEILEDGRPQTITNFSYIVTAKPAGGGAHPATPPAAPGMITVPPVRLEPEQVRRSIVVLVDDLHITFQDMYYVRRALTKFIDDAIQPGDLVAILHTSGGLGVRQQFTNDKRVLHAAVDRLRYYLPSGWVLDEMGPGDLAPGGEKDEVKTFRKDLEGAAHNGSVFRERFTTVGTIEALAYVLGGLREFPGRKAIFLVSDGFGLGPREVMETRLRVLSELANRSATVVYTLGAQGLPTLMPDVSAGSPSINPGPGWFANELQRKSADYFALQRPMAYLARQTEGLFIHNNNDLAGGMHEMMDDLRGYYLIGYKPPVRTFTEDKAGRGYHKIEVKVKGHGLHVRSRRGFYGTPDSDIRPVFRTRQAQLLAAAVSPFGTSGVRVEVAPQFLSRGDKDVVARLWLHVDARDLTLQDGPGGNKNGAADLVAVAFGDNGALESGVENTVKGSLQPTDLESGRERGMDARLDLPIKKPGGYQVRVAVGDAGSQKLGSASQFIEVPDLRPDRQALSGIVLNPQLLGESGPAMRRFKAGERVNYELEIYHARRDGAGALHLESQVQIFHDGRLVPGQNTGAIRRVAQDSTRLAMSGEFELSPDLAPGDYVLLVTVTDNLAPPRHSTAHQGIDFEVVR